MTLWFVFKGTKKDGTSQLDIRFKDGSLKNKNNDVRIKVD